MAFLYPVRRLSSVAPKLVLYKRDASPPACAVMLVARRLGLTMQYEEPQLLQLEHKTAEFRELNPMGVIPVLKDGDFIISESQAIILYLVEKYGGEQRSQLYPEDLETRALVNQCLFFNAGYFFIRLKNVALPTMLRGLKAPSAQHLADLEEAYGVLEAYLRRRPYLAAGRLTVADVCCGATAAGARGVLAVDGDKFPRTKAWMDRLEEDEDYKSIVAGGGEQLAKLLQIFWAKNNKSE